MENKNLEYSLPGEKIKELPPISNLAVDKIVSQTSSPQLSSSGQTSEGSCRIELSTESEEKDESKDRRASESFDSAIGNENLSFQNSPFRTNVMMDRSTSDSASVSMIAENLMTTSDEESATGETENPSLTDPAYAHTFPNALKLVAEEPIKAESLPCFSVNPQKDIRNVHKVLSPAGEASAASFLTGTVLLSPSTSPENSPRMVARSSQCTKDSNLTRNEASNIYETNLRKFLKDTAPQNSTDEGNLVTKEMSGLAESKNPKELVTTKLCIKSELESNTKVDISKQEVIPSHGTIEMKLDSDGHIATAASEACSSELDNLQLQPMNFRSPKEVMEVFKVPESPAYFVRSPKRLKSPKSLISDRNSGDKEKNGETSIVKKPKSPTSLNLSPRLLRYTFCPSESGSILRVSRSLPDMREGPKKEDKGLTMNADDLKDNKCVKALDFENIKPKTVSPKHSIPSSNTEQIRGQISPPQLDVMDETGKDSSQEQYSVNEQSVMPGKLPSSDKIKARKKLTFAFSSGKDTEKSDMEVESSSRDCPRNVSGVESEFLWSRKQLLEGNKAPISLSNTLPSIADKVRKNLFGSDSNNSELPSLQGSSLSTMNVTSKVLKSNTEEEMEQKGPITAFEISPRKRKSSSPESEVSKKSRLIKLHNEKTLSNVSHIEIEGSQAQNEPLIDQEFMSTENTLGSSELSVKEHSPMKDVCMSDSNRLNESDN